MKCELSRVEGHALIVHINFGASNDCGCPKATEVGNISSMDDLLTGHFNLLCDCVQ